MCNYYCKAPARSLDQAHRLLLTFRTRLFPYWPYLCRRCQYSVSFGPVYAAINLILALSLAGRDRRKNRPPAQGGFMKSNTMASALSLLKASIKAGSDIAATCFIVTTQGNDGTKGVSKRPASKKNQQREYRRRWHRYTPCGYLRSHSLHCKLVMLSNEKMKLGLKRSRTRGLR